LSWLRSKRNCQPTNPSELGMFIDETATEQNTTHADVKSTKGEYYNVKGLGASVLLYFADSSPTPDLLRDLKNFPPITTDIKPFINVTQNACRKPRAVEGRHSLKIVTSKPNKHREVHKFKLICD